MSWTDQDNQNVRNGCDEAGVEFAGLSRFTYGTSHCEPDVTEPLCSQGLEREFISPWFPTYLRAMG